MPVEPVEARVAAVDCGTNSIRLLVADEVDGKLVDVAREMVIVRLGQGVDATGQFAPEAIERTREALAGYVEQMTTLGVQRVRMVATSATRDASNRDDFFAMTADLLGQVHTGAVAEVISGEEEAALSFRGAVGGLDPADGPFVVTDLGGGSTEVVTDSAAYSAQIGCVRLTERALPSDPPTLDEVEKARGYAREELAKAWAVVDDSLVACRTWVGVAGTLTTFAALHLGLTEYEPDRIHHSRIPLADLHRICSGIVGETREQRLALGPMHPGRADVIGGGALVTQELARHFADHSQITAMVVSEHDILDGIALGLLD
ncbi:MAG: Ppx/GppA phosphatase family protein [Gordonia sp. (in: high G+C Gram-positive bacteria)]